MLRASVAVWAPKQQMAVPETTGLHSGLGVEFLVEACVYPALRVAPSGSSFRHPVASIPQHGQGPEYTAVRGALHPAPENRTTSRFPVRS